MNREGLERLYEKFKNFKMIQQPTRNFDPKGFINNLRTNIRRFKFYHQSDFREDVITNCLDAKEVNERKVKMDNLPKNKGS